LTVFVSGNDYEAHTKCISEEEKYSGKNYKPKPNANKGEMKQELWTQVCECLFAVLHWYYDCLSATSCLYFWL